LNRNLGRPPTVRQIAAATGLQAEAVLEAMEAASAYEAVSLDGPPKPNGQEDPHAFAEVLGAEEHKYELVEYETALAPALRALPPRDRLLLHMRYVEDLTQAHIAERIGVSQMHVSRLIRRSLARLRTMVGPS
jgi:RNA polymerase sigma-B factor